MFKFLIILISIGIVASQRSDFVDYVLDLQYAAGYIHDIIQDTTWKSRYVMSDELTDIVRGTMTEVTNGLSAYLSMQNRFSGYIEDARTPENTECIDQAIAEWTPIQKNAGAKIGACGSNPMNILHEHVFGYHQFVNSHRQIKFDAQNVVLNAFTKLNPMTNFFDLTPTVSDDIDEIHDIYQRDVNSGIIERLEGFANLKQDVPIQVHDCIAAVLNNFSSESESIIEEALAC